MDNLKDLHEIAGASYKYTSFNVRFSGLPPELNNFILVTKEWIFMQPVYKIVQKMFTGTNQSFSLNHHLVVVHRLGTLPRSPIGLLAQLGFLAHLLSK